MNAESTKKAQPTLLLAEKQYDKAVISAFINSVGRPLFCSS